MSKNSKWYFIAGFFLSVLAAGIGFAAVGVWPFGDKTLLIIDSIHQYLPFYTDMHEKLINGESLLYSFSGGLGYNFWSTYAYYLASPLNFLMALIPTENVCDFMDLAILLKIGLCGGCFSWYLHKRNPKSRFLPVSFGMAFALSSFVIGYYFNLMWLDSIAMTPLIMYGIEQIVEGKRGRFYGLALFYGLWCNYYIGFMLCLFSCLYFLVRWISAKEIRAVGILKSCLSFGWYSLLAGVSAALVLLPAFMGLSSSESMQGNSFPSTVKFYTSLAEMMENHMILLEPVNISDSQVGLNVYCGIFTVVLVLIYLFDHRIKLRERMAHLNLCGLFLFSFSFNIFNYIWHGFHIQNGLPNRFAFLYIAVLLVMAYDALGHIQEIRLTALLEAAGIPILFVFYLMFFGEREIPSYAYWISLGLIVLYLAILLSGRYFSQINRTVFQGMLAAVMLAELAGNAIFGISCNGSVTRSIYLADQRSYRALLEEQGDDSFFRSEVDRQRMRNVTMFAGGNALVMFNSTMQDSVIEFCDSLGIEARTNKNGYNGVTRLMNSVLGIKYVASPNHLTDTFYSFDYQGEDGELSLYKNEDALSIGFMVSDDLKDWDTDAGEPLQVQNSFVNLAAGMDSIFELDRTIVMEDGETYEIRIPENKQVYLCLDTRVAKIQLNTPEYSKTYNDYTDHLYQICGSGEERTADFTVTLKSGQSQAEAHVYVCADEAYEEVIQKLSRNQMTDVQVDGNQVRGTVTAGESGTLLLTIPYDKGWKIRVDGKDTEFYEIGSALMGVHLEKGTHTVTMKYTPPGFFAGLLLTLAGVLLLFLTAVWERRNPAWFQRKNKETDEMEMIFSEKAQRLDAGIFAVLNEKKNELEAQGKKIYNLSIGTPDFHPEKHVIDAVSEAAKDPENYKYAVVELPQLLESAQKFFKRRFHLDLEKEEIMEMYGSQEGMAHIAWALCNPGDLVLVPNPGYQIFRVGPQLCDAQIYEYPLYAKDGFLPDLEAIPEEVARRAKLMVVSYPSNPCCRLAPDSFYEELIAFARKYNIIILHDNAYADLVFGKEGGSFLQYEGAREVGIEFYSLSKTFNYTGARVSFAIGNKEIISRFRALRTQFDYGTFLPVQYGAIAAMDGSFNGVIRQCRRYEERSRTLCQGLREIGWQVPDTDGTMFVWAPLPEGYTNSEEFVMELMEKTGVICVPGTSFGSLGEGYVRMALVLPPEKLREAVESIRVSGILSVKEKNSEQEEGR